MNFKVKPGMALIIMLVVGGLVIYIGSSLGFKAQNTQPVVLEERCAEKNAQKLKNLYNSALSLQVPTKEDKKLAYLRVIKDHSEFSDCQNVVTQVTKLAEYLVQHETDSVEKLTVVYSVLHTLENSVAGFTVSDSNYNEATNISEFYLRSVDQSIIANNPEQQARYQDLSLMLATALDKISSGRADLWRPKKPITDSGGTDKNINKANRRDAL